MPAGVNPLRVIVTRPAAQAEEWVAALRRQAIDAVALPLIGIAAPADPSAVVHAWETLAEQQWLVFVSPNAAEQFFALRPSRLAWPSHVRAASPGPGTTGVLRRLGVPADCITEPAADALQFDSESLWQQMSANPWQGAKVQVVRGESGRDWLAEKLRQQGADVGFVTAYRRVLPQLDAQALDLLGVAIGSPEHHLWFFSSSEAIDNLMRLSPSGASSGTWQRSQALATHPRIAERAGSAGFRRVLQSRPELSCVVACIQSAAS
jgi:uroporphyrinogen-III synthase